MSPTSGIRGFVASLNRRPERIWPEGVQHHGMRIVILSGLAVLTAVLFPVAQAPDFPTLELGMVPDEDIIAIEGFPVPVPAAELEFNRGRAADAVPPVFRYDSTAIDTMRFRIMSLLDRVDAAFEAGTAEAESRQRLQDALLPLSLPAGPNEYALLEFIPNRMALRRSLQASLDDDLVRMYADASELLTGRTTSFRIKTATIDRLVERDSVLTAEQVRDAAARHLSPTLPAGLVEFQRLVLTRLMIPTLEPDYEETAVARQYARDAVPTVKSDVVKGERVIPAYERIEPDDIERLEAYRAYLLSQGMLTGGPAFYLNLAGSILLNALLILVFGMLLKLYRPGIYTSFRAVLLLTFLFVSVTVPAGVIAGSAAPSVLIPIVFPALVAAVLWDGRMALIFALVLVFLLTVQGPLQELSVRVLLISGGAAAALSVRVVHRRAHGLILGAVAASAYVLATLAVGLLRSWELAPIATTAVLGSANGIACALIAVGLMPVFEAWAGITTDQTLLELGDLNGPLLKRLSLEASGTYAHSINVAHLAEAAARAIGANPLLVRVGAYYHDIGKMAAPQYFVENQAGGRNPHDRLSPEDSVAIIRGHVVEGMRMADEAKLPACVRAFIPEHHGSQLIGFFYEKARKRDGGDELDPDQYSYPGPVPRSRETAILMLADSVESAAKALDDPTPDSIRDMVERIVQGKINRGQLEEAPLTFRELARIREAFGTVLGGMYHHRLDYPPSAIGLQSMPPGTVTAGP